MAVKPRFKIWVRIDGSFKDLGSVRGEAETRKYIEEIGKNGFWDGTTFFPPGCIGYIRYKQCSPEPFEA